MMIKILGIPFDANSSFLRGSAQAPPRIRLMESDGSANNFAELGQEIAEGMTYMNLGDLSFPDTRPEQVYQTIKSSVAKAIEDGSALLILGGDHSISYPIIEAFAEKHPNLNVLHLDAHADLYENFENNPYSHASPFARLMEKGLLQSLTQVGIRTLNPHQRSQAKKFGVNVVEMKDFDFHFLATLKGPLYVSLDLDVLDPAFAPGVSHHEPGGISTRELIRIIQNIPVPIFGADIVEYNPTRDHQNMTAMVAYKMFKEIIARMIS